MIIVRLKGGMGNQMFQYALGRSLSIKNRVPFKIDISSYKIENEVKRRYDLGIFNIVEDIAEEKEIPLLYRNLNDNLFLSKINSAINKFMKNKGKETSFSFDSKVLGLGSDIYLDGYWQSQKYFIDIEDIIRRDFTLKKKLSLNIENLKELIKKENSLCIHVRRGDYVGNKKHEVVGRDYYDNAIEKMERLTKIDNIYVFSDDIKWCEENMKFEFPTTFVGEEYAGENAEGHLVLMSACNNFIIPNSSFSWWAAWLSDYKDKIVIAPKQWFGDKNINTDDLISNEWIRI